MSDIAFEKAFSEFGQGLADKEATRNIVYRYVDLIHGNAKAGAQPAAIGKPATEKTKTHSGRPADD